MIKAKHFDIRELVPRHVYLERADKAWQLLDDRFIITADALREEYGPMVINNWHFKTRPIWAENGKLREWSGLRTTLSPWGSMYSQHMFGRSGDGIFRDVTAEDVRQDILKHPDKFPLIGSLELGTSWLHFDVRNCDRIMTYYP